MNLSTQKLQYLLEIESTRSISQAASNLYMAQPNLSRILREMEEQVGFQIFERFQSGVVPTVKGRVFLLRAKSILQDLLFIEQLQLSETPHTNLRICLPRSFTLIDLITKQLKEDPAVFSHDFSFEECGSLTALDRLESGTVDLAYLRYHPKFQNHIKMRAATNNLELITLPPLQYEVLLSENNILAGCEQLEPDMLHEQIRIACRSHHLPAQSVSKENCIYTNDRLTQLQLLKAIPDSYSWAEPLPDYFLADAKLVQIPCASIRHQYNNTLAFHTSPYSPDEFQKIVQYIKDTFIIGKSQKEKS